VRSAKALVAMQPVSKLLLAILFTLHLFITFFTGRMPFLPNQQHQSAEVTSLLKILLRQQKGHAARKVWL